MIFVRVGARRVFCVSGLVSGPGAPCVWKVPPVCVSGPRAFCRGLCRGTAVLFRPCLGRGPALFVEAGGPPIIRHVPRIRLTHLPGPQLRSAIRAYPAPRVHPQCHLAGTAGLWGSAVRHLSGGALRAHGPQLRSAPSRHRGPTAPIRVPLGTAGPRSACHPSATAGPQLRSACHPSGTAGPQLSTHPTRRVPFFAGENPKPYCLGGNNQITSLICLAWSTVLRLSRAIAILGGCVNLGRGESFWGLMVIQQDARDQTSNNNKHMPLDSLELQQASKNRNKLISRPSISSGSYLS